MEIIEKIVRVVMVAIMFWNLENFFDPFEGGAIGSAGSSVGASAAVEGAAAVEYTWASGYEQASGWEYTPRGEKRWTWRKFCVKRDLIAKIIISTRDACGVFPSIIGVCEVENLFVLQQLVRETPLNALGYKILHRNSIDRRGIDVALLYREEDVKVLEEEYFPPRDTLLKYNLRTRYVLYAKCVVRVAGSGNGDILLHSGIFGEVDAEEFRTDTLHIFVNHWPSKLGGSGSSRRTGSSNGSHQLSQRMFIARAVRQKCDSILYFNPDARIVLMGDFNDTPESEPVRYLCEGEDERERSVLVNLAATQSRHKWGNGSYKYKGKWEAIDQFIVSGSVAAGGSTTARMQIWTHPALLKDDKSYLGKQINRTNKGPRYTGGASDHLPIILTIKCKKCCIFNP